MMTKKEIIEAVSDKNFREYIILVFIKKGILDARNNFFVQDAIQNTIFKLIIENKYSFPNKSKLNNWAVTVSYHNFIDMIRNKEKRSVKLDDNLKSEIKELNDDIEFFNNDRLVKSLKKLPKKQQEIIDYIIYRKYKYRDVVEETGESINTLLARMRYAITNLKKIYHG